MCKALYTFRVLPASPQRVRQRANQQRGKQGNAKALRIENAANLADPPAQGKVGW